MRRSVIEFLKLVDREEVLKRLSGWTVPDFPVNGSVLKANGIAGQNRVINFLKALKEKWIDNNFVLHDNLIAEVAYQFKTNESNKT